MTEHYLGFREVTTSSASRMCTLPNSRLLKKSPSRYVKGGGQLFDHADRWIARSSLQVAHIRSVDARMLRVFFLAPAALIAQAAQIDGKALVNFHSPPKTSMSPMNLQTISDIRLDGTA